MKTRKRIILGVAIVACVMASCKKNEETPTNSVVFKANIESCREAGDDKTAIDTSTGRVVWLEDDQIRIHNGTTSHIFTLISAAGSTQGDFCFNGGYVLTDNYLAAYPTTGQITFNSSTAQVVFNLPAMQNLGEADSTFANGANPMVARATDINDLNFMNVCGGIGIRLRGAEEDITVSNIRITSKNSDDCLWGNLTVIMNDGTLNDNNISISNGAENKNVIDLSCDFALSTTETKRVFIVLPIGTLSGGFTLDVTYKENGGENQTFTKTTSSDPEVADDATVVRNTLKSLPVLDIGQAYTVSVSANPSDGGTVTGGGTYNQDASCTVTATANEGYTFTNWTEDGNVVSTEATYTFTVNANRNLVANFTH